MEFGKEGRFERKRPEDEFAKALSSAVGEDISVETDDDTHSIDTDTFRLSFVLHEDSFEIRDIRSATPGRGRDVVTAIQKYCDSKGLDVYASNVLGTAEGFWRKMGYQEGAAGEFFHAG